MTKRAEITPAAEKERCEYGVVNGQAQGTVSQGWGVGEKRAREARSDPDLT